MAEGIILAAGFAKRAKTNKLLLPVLDKPILMHAIEGMQPYVSHIYVITGHYHDQIKAYLKGLSYVTCLRNSNYHLGMFSSVLLGVSMIKEDFFILPGDCPFVSKKTYDIMLLANEDVVVPSYHKKRGHPIFIRKKLKDLLLIEPIHSHLKAFRNKTNFITIEVDDPHILDDIDTIKDYKKILVEQKGVD